MKSSITSICYYGILFTSYFTISVPVAAFSTHYGQQQQLFSDINFISNSESRLSTNLNISIRRKRTEPAVVGYVPSGLTPEQYAKIKKQELDEKKGKNYAAWGPKFAKSGRPDGDWMVVPSLWTGGFDSNAQYSTTAKPYGGGNRNFLGALVHGFKKYTPVYAFALLFIEVLVAAGHIHNVNAKTASSLLAVAYYQIKSRTAMTLLSTDMMIKVTAAKMVMVGLIVKPLSMVIENCNRRLLWSPRRTMTYGSLISFSTLLISFLIRRVMMTNVI